MRHVLSAVFRPVIDRARSLAEGWDTFWFTPADPTLLGLIRLATGLMLLYTHAVWGLALDDFYGPNGWLSAGLMRTLQANETAYSLWWWVPARWIWPAYGASMVILALFTVGLWTRLTSVLALVVTISFIQRVALAMFGLDQINVLLTLYLAIGYLAMAPRDRALSLDRWRALRRQRAGAAPTPPSPSVGANLAQRLIQVHMCVTYFFAGTSKLQGPAWWNGEAMWRAVANLEYQSADLTWLAWCPWVLNLATHLSVLWEIFFCALIWSRAWRPLMLAGAVVLHLGIGAFLGMWTFGLIMLVGCASFLPNEAVRQLVAALIAGRLGSSTAGEPLPALPSGPVNWVDYQEAPEPALMADGGR